MTRPRTLVSARDPHVRNSAASALWSIGAETRRVSSGAMALRLLRRRRPFDLVVVDDVTTARQARSQGASMPIVVLAERDSDEVVRATRELRDTWLIRGFEPKRLSLIADLLLGSLELSATRR